MGFSIAVAGKGGSGKTTLSALIIRKLTKTGFKPILAIDADPNTNLGESLGCEVRETVGSMLDKFQKEKVEIPAGMTKEAYLEFKLNSLIVEKRDFDLIAMGRGEGQGCYCYPNSILRKVIDRFSEDYACVVMDNEAGMEHLSRGTTRDIDILLIVSNHSIKGVRTIGRIKELVSELRLKIRHQFVVINLVPDGLDPLVEKELDHLGLRSDFVIPLDNAIVRADVEQRPLTDLPDHCPSVLAVEKMVSGIVSTIKPVV